ncbi:serine hydrolase domain-containing protein [Qipengyuania flava]|uniref:serine hydrolase domain-containing protein n=1 Tax=Qipengyuania flava TaxID=192812 RepID=UPI001C63065F|nr:serine hydrolase domain-containing protein [Qipengyuania flava]QYJ06507.1 beta-lactamase family protein [Qipengyuania flava]
MRSLILPALAPALALALAPPALAASEPTQTASEIRGPGDLDRAELLGEVEAILAKHAVPGAHVTLTMGPDIVLSRAFGTDPSAGGAPYTEQTPARLASASKLLTALTVLSMVEEGTLSLDETLGSLDADLPAHWHAIPIWRVLNHTSGIPMIVTREDFNALSQEEQLALTPADLLAMIGSEPLDFAPGEGWHYQQGAYALLTRSLEKRTGMAWTDLVAQHVTGPTAMASTGFAPLAQQAAAYEIKDGELVQRPGVYPAIFAAAGGIDTTPADAAGLLLGLSQGRILTEETLRHVALDAERLHRLGRDVEGEGYGLAMVVQRFGDLTFFGHSGGGGLADIRYAPGRQLGIAVLTNRAGGTGAATEIADLIATRLVGDAHRTPRAATGS